MLDKFSSKPKPIGIQDLQNEISQIKFQIKEILDQNQNLEPIFLLIRSLLSISNF